jgi:hypothetical protein
MKVEINNEVNEKSDMKSVPYHSNNRSFTLLQKIKLFLRRISIRNAEKDPNLFNKFLISLEIFQTVFSLFILIWQFFLAVSVSNEGSQILELDSYKYIQNTMIYWEIMGDLKVIPKNRNCTEAEFKMQPYNLLQISGINNTCIENIDGKNYLRFEQGCTEKADFDNLDKVSLDTVGDYKLCYLTSPKENYRYRFVKNVERCNDDEIKCGDYESSIICLQKNNYVTKCPIVEVWFSNINDVLWPGFYNLTYIKIFNRNLIYANETTSIWPFLSSKLKIETSSDINYYEFFKKNARSYNNDSELIFKTYNEKYDYTSDYFDTNPYYDGRVSDFVEEIFDFTSEDFFNWFDITPNNTEILYQTLDPSQKLYLRMAYFSLPNFQCISDLFMNENNPDSIENNNRGFFSKMSDVNFDFLNLNLVYYITWSFIQAGTFFIYSILYRVSILSDKINHVLREIDRKSEPVTILTLKLFYYLCLAMKLLIIYHCHSFTKDKYNFIQYLVNNKCFDKYVQRNELPDDSLLHLNLRQFLNETPLVRFMVEVQSIFTITYIEIGNEVLSLIFIVVGFMF